MMIALLQGVFDNMKPPALLGVPPALFYAVVGVRIKELSIINPYTNNRSQEATARRGLQVCGRV